MTAARFEADLSPAVKPRRTLQVPHLLRVSAAWLVIIRYHVRLTGQTRPHGVRRQRAHIDRIPLHS